MDLSALVIFFGVISLQNFVVAVDYTHSTPIIGIVPETLPTSAQHQFPEPTFIRSSYINYIQQAGGRVVPIKINQTDEYYEKMFKYINGVLFPGGGVSIVTSGYAKAAQKMFKMAIEANKNGDYFPMWGTCLGFELLSALVSGKDLLVECSAEDISLKLGLSRGYQHSRLFKSIPSHILNILVNNNVTGNFHHRCLTPQAYLKTPALSKFYKVLSTNKDKNGLEFISMIEAYGYPFYGSQWHPEKNNFNFDPTYHLDRGIKGVLVSQHFANFFVQEAWKSKHRFPDFDTENSHLINNYKLIYSGTAADQYRERYFIGV